MRRVIFRIAELLGASGKTLHAISPSLYDIKLMRSIPEGLIKGIEMNSRPNQPPDKE